jgi:putative oxidoreductase
MITAIRRAHDAVFGRIQHATQDWLPALFARFAFASVLFAYYFTSFKTKIGEGFLGFLTVADGAYFQIVPGVVEAAGYDVSKIPVFPFGIIVHAGTWAEFVLPVLIVIGLFTRIAALGMTGFIAVQSYVDVRFHGIGPEATGALFDRFPDAAILDQRLMWLVPLVYLAIKGAGLVSLDAALARLFPSVAIKR